MNKIITLLGMIMLCCTMSYPIGMQHGVFRSQSTQGSPWQGTATITDERYDITVYPDYLDVELQWIFKASGTTEPDSFKDAIEIVGNFNIVANSTITSMITWYNGKILKGKLKTDSVAREQYEKVVDRSSDRPPPPRDPVLIEYGWGEDNYDISIFPVSFNGTRQIRFRYLIPAFSVNGVNKIAYPHAFTENATVTIRKGAGVENYYIETGVKRTQYDNNEPVVLNDKDYGLMAYGGRSASPTISYIVPVLPQAPNGSVIYSSNFSTPAFSGEMSHVITMTAKEALKHTSLAEDYVILWRWNHPQIMCKYARQIVEQSKLLKKFLSTLEAANKRAALIISKEGGETVSFRLDNSEGSEFKRMTAYLDSLSDQTITDPPVISTSKPLDIKYDAEKELGEFESAIKAAIDMFEKDNSSMKHLLILMAGPCLLSSYTQKTPAVVLDSSIHASLLSDYLGAEEIRTASSSVNQIYWPGVNGPAFLQKYDERLSIYATIGNGTDTNRISVLDKNTEINQMHIYSSKPLTADIRWSIYKDSNLLTSFSETPKKVRIEDGMQYARLIGSSKHLTPFASVMPSSIASSLGFVDKKYSLVALEEDYISEVEAVEYNKSGVPLLNPEDIFRSPDERADLPVADWLKENPPVPIMNYSTNSLFNWAGGIKDINVVFSVELDSGIKKEVLPGDVAARLGTPQAQTIYSAEAGGYIDYSAAVSVEKNPEHLKMQSLKSIPLTFKNGSLIIDISKIKLTVNEPLKIMLYSCSGKLLGTWYSSSAADRFTVDMKSFAHGNYMLRVTGKTPGVLQQMIVR
jgi:hypothetical protein